jgi:hypothetical protein
MREYIEKMKNWDKNTVNEEQNFKPTTKEPVNDFSKSNENNTNTELNAQGVNLTETDVLLTEKEQSLKKKIFSLAKMESLVFSDPKLSSVYDEMSENGEEKYGYHYNETIMNIIFNDYVLNSSKYLQKYKMAVPKKKKRRDKSGINQLKKSHGGAGMTPIDNTKELKENEEPTKVQFLVNDVSGDGELFAYFPEEQYNDKYKSGYSHVGQHSAVHPKYAEESREATPEEYADLKAELESIGYNLEVLNGMSETTGASSSGAYGAPMGMISRQVNELDKPAITMKHNENIENDETIDETSTTGSVGGDGMGSGGYATPAAWGKGDLIKGKQSPITAKPIWQGGKVIQESEYLTDPSGFQKLVEEYEMDDNATSNENMYTSKDQLIGVKITRELVPQIAGDALYAVAIQLANQIIPVATWDDLPDTNSMWDYIDQNGGMTWEVLKEAVKDAVNDRLDGADFPINEEAKSQSQRGLIFGKRNQYKTKEATPDKWKWIWDEDWENKGKLPDKVDETAGVQTDITDQANAAKSAVKGKSIDSAISDKVEDEIDNEIEKNNDNITETETSMIGDNPTTMALKPEPEGSVSTGNVPTGLNDNSMNEEKLFEDLDNELNAYSIHQEKLMKIDEDRKPSSLVLKDRLGKENQSNFKSDMKKSDTKDVIDVEKELQWKDQQTDVKDPQKLGADIEKKALKVTDGEALKNVGNSANDKGDEIPKRNFTDDEQDEVDLLRKGLGDFVFDNKPDERFEERMKKDMGDDLYKKRQEKMEFSAKAPMYNKEEQPVDDSDDKKTQFDKYKTGFNDKIGINESMISGRYHDVLNKSHMIDFELKDVQLTESIENLYPIDFTGLGNSYNSKSIDNKIIVNEAVVNALNTYKYYTNGSDVFAIENKKSLNENENVEKPIVSEDVNKMKHLLGYKPSKFVNTDSIKKNRGF